MTRATKVPLDKWERKKRLGHGGIKRIAEIAEVDQAFVSRVVSGTQRNERIEGMVAAAIGKPGELVFPPRQTEAA